MGGGGWTIHREANVLRRLTTGDHTGPPIGINLSLDLGFRRGEGGWEAGWWACMVARGWGETAHAS
jgi:hypothetical protein